MLHFRHDSVIETPFESAFHRTGPLTEFAASLRWTKLDDQATALLTLGDAEAWPCWFFKAKQSAFWYGWKCHGQPGADWEVKEVPLKHPQSHQLHVNCFNGKLTVYVDNTQVGEVDFTARPQTWSIGATPYMQGRGIYGGARITEVELRAVPYFQTPDPDANQLLNFSVLDGFEWDIANFANPAILKIDVDDLSALKLRKGWPNADAQVDALYVLLKDVCTSQLDYAVAARSHYKGLANDELVVLGELQTLEHVANALQTKLAATTMPGCDVGEMSVSSGIGVGARSFSILYSYAGVALTKAKKEGKRCLRIFRQEKR